MCGVYLPNALKILETESITGMKMDLAISVMRKQMI